MGATPQQHHTSLVRAILQRIVTTYKARDRTRRCHRLRPHPATRKRDEMSTVIPLTPAEQAKMLAGAPLSARTGLVHFRLCPFCGHADWVSSSAEGEPKISAEIGESACQICLSVQRRSPEVFQWVLNVVDWNAIIMDRLLDKNEPRLMP